jgi:predicted ATPase
MPSLLCGGTEAPQVLPQKVTQWRAGLELQLLSGAEQTVFRRLAVFAGDWGLEAEETVCAGEGLASASLLDILTRLVDKSLVQVVQQNGEGDIACGSRFAFSLP